jgi:hypothetical protein
MPREKRKSAYSLALEQVQGKEKQESGNVAKISNIQHNSNTVKNGNAASNSDLPQNLNTVKNDNTALGSEEPQYSNTVENGNTVNHSNEPLNSNTVKNSEVQQSSKAVKRSHTAKITIYPTQEQVDKLYDLMDAYRRRTGFKINQQDMIRRLIDLANENTVLP